VSENEKLTMTLTEAAKRLGISRGLAYSLAAQGGLPVIRLGEKRLLVPIHALEKMLADAENLTKPNNIEVNHADSE
jgi:excisionase family DNA binding protein